MKQIFIVLVVLFGLSVTSVMAMKTFAQQSQPLVAGCSGLADEECSFLKIGSPKTILSVNGKPLKGKQLVVHYGDTVTGSLQYTNTSVVPLTVSKISVVAKPRNGAGEVLFTPTKGQTVLQPGQTISLATTFHKFNYPDQPGEWIITGRVTNTDNQSVDGTNPDTITLVADCTPLRATNLDKDAEKLLAFCNDKPDSALCKEFCEVRPDIAPNCMPPEDGHNATQPGKQLNDAGQFNSSTSSNPDSTEPVEPEISLTPDIQISPTPNPIVQLQTQFQEFLLELRRIFGQ